MIGLILSIEHCITLVCECVFVFSPLIISLFSCFSFLLQFHNNGLLFTSGLALGAGGCILFVPIVSCYYWNNKFIWKTACISCHLNCCVSHTVVEKYQVNLVCNELLLKKSTFKAFNTARCPLCGKWSKFGHWHLRGAVFQIQL